ncbi:MAG TPA: peptidylprolyl isomerase [Gemmataceae bacterium]|nr:peptidylprolyl isomerase [Gemmataceae bacterium]
MRRLASAIGNLLNQTKHRKTRTPIKARRRLQLEALEDRCVPSANASGVISGLAFADTNNNGIFNSGEATLPGISLTLTGKTSQGTPVSTTTTTDAAGAYNFANVLPGTYGISSTGGSTVLGSPSVSGLSVAGGQTVTRNLAFQGFAPGVISMRLFLASSTSADLPFAPAGSGTGLANFRPNNAPTVVTTASTAVTMGKNTGRTIIDLAAHFTDPDITNSTVRFDTSDGPINVQLFDTQAPQTVANFLNYVKSGAYNNSIFHRLVNNFVIQGGGFAFNSTSKTITAIPASPAVANEFGTSNTQGTLAMALVGSDINSGTDQFFFNLVNNASSLDAQKFTVFGKIVGSADQNVLTALAGTTTKDESANNPAFGTIPLNNYTGTNFPTDAKAANFLMINDIAIVNQDEFLTYKVFSNSNPSLVTASVDPKDNALLDLTSANQTGNATIVVRATDRYGATVDTSFTVSVINQPPTATAALNTSTPLATDSVTATATDSDPDGDLVTLTYQWKVNGTTVRTTANTGNLTDTLNLSGIAKAGDAITVNVTPNDGSLDGTAASATATVAAPSAGTVSFTPSSPTSTSTLTANLSASNAHDFTYVWTVNGNAVQTDTIAGTSDALTQALHSGDQITIQVTPSDGVNTGTPATASVTVA